MVSIEKNMELEPEKTCQHDTVIDKETRVYSLEILKIIKEAQQQHGLRHGDYQRYRRYCSRRLRRLRKVLHVPQGDRRHFKRKDINSSMVNNDKFLQIPMTMAERAWSYAMQLRIESNTEPRKRFHLISRLRKAAVYAFQLQNLIENINCDARTKLEVQAYVAWILGSLQFELQLWKDAMTNFQKAQLVYTELASALPESEQIIYKSRVEELAPNLRYCAYNVGDDSAIDDLMQMRGQLSSDLLLNLDNLISQTRDKKSNLKEVSWRGKSCGIIPPRVAGILMAESQLTLTLSKAQTLQNKIDLLEAHLIDCKDVMSFVRETLKAELKNKDEKTPAQYLMAYLQHIRLSRTMERNLLLIKNVEGSAKVKPQDIVRLYEAVLHNLVELSQLLEDDSDYLREQEAKTKAYRAFRCYFMAQSLGNLQMWKEAAALYQRALEHVKDALKDQSILPKDLVAEVEKLETAVECSKCSVHAQSVLQDGIKDESGVFGKLTKSKKPLAERLNEYIEDPSLLTKQPNVFTLPPPMKPIPCKPLFFDLAFNMVEFPDLTENFGDQGKKSQAGLTGFVKGLWGWGNK